MARDVLLNVAYENVARCFKEDWKESDEVILFSTANEQEVKLQENFKEDYGFYYYGKRICMFADQIKKNRYMILDKKMLEKLIGQIGRTEEKD